jgi:acid phosphatase
VTKRVRALAVIGAALSLAACSTSAGGSHANPSPRPTQTTAFIGPVAPVAPVAPTAAASTAAAPAKVTKALTVVLENHGAAAALAQMPRLAGLAHKFGYTTRYNALAHDSLPNYIAMTAGATAGVEGDGGPDVNAVQGPSVFDQALAHGGTAKTYAEGMPTNCARSDAGRYVVHHNPWVYFTDASSHRACQINDVPAGTTAAGALHADIAAGRLPTIGMVVPDLCNDAHDCALSTADTWLTAWVEQVFAGPDWQAGRLALVVTFDEAEESSTANGVLTVVAAPGVTSRVVSRRYTHVAWSGWMSRLAGATPLRDAAKSPSLGAGFGL